MADTRSGSKQVLKMKRVEANSYVTVAEPGDDSGFGGLNMSFEPSTFENASGGLTSTHNSGQVVVTADCSVAENEVTIPLLLGANGQRFDVDWEPQGADANGKMFEAIATVSRTFEDRGKVMFEVALAVDGPITDG